ncbi:MAG: hypothetical protein ABIT01_12785 [Thermoanaerobaculia bacterium]
MKRVITVSALCLAASFAFAATGFAQATTSTQKTTEINADGSTKTTTKITTVEGKVVRYEPGKTIVVVESDNREVSFALAPDAAIPADIEVGRYVSLSTENSDAGPMTVTRVTTRSVTPEGNIKTETQTKGTKPNGDQVSSSTTSVTGTVQEIHTGRSVTLVLPDKKTVEYTIDSSSSVPADLAVGKTVTVQTTRSTAGAPLIVKKITASRRTTTKKTTTVH